MRLREQCLSLNFHEPDEVYAGRRYDRSWRSIKAGALLAALVAAIAFLV